MRYLDIFKSKSSYVLIVSVSMYTLLVFNQRKLADIIVFCVHFFPESYREDIWEVCLCTESIPD